MKMHKNQKKNIKNKKKKKVINKKILKKTKTEINYQINKILIRKTC